MAAHAQYTASHISKSSKLQYTAHDFTVQFTSKCCTTTTKNINYCVRGGHKPARWPWPTSTLTEMEKWSWIRIRNPISTKIELVLQVHPLLPPTKFGGDPWTRSWDILRTNTVRTDRHTPMITGPCGLRRAGNKHVEYSFEWSLFYRSRNRFLLTVTLYKLIGSYLTIISAMFLFLAQSWQWVDH